MTPADRILELLYDRRGGAFSPDELALAVGVSPAQVAEAVEELARRGHRLERSPTQGLRLTVPVRLDEHLIRRGLRVRRVGRRVICLEEVDSTNDACLALAGEAVAGALVVTAEHQRAGRGRLGRRWLSPSGSGVLASVLLEDPQQRLAHEALTVAAGVAVAEGVQEATGVRPRLDWPNDVLVEGAKLAGVMVEVRADGGRRRLVVGFGINVTSAPPPEGLRRPATHLAAVAEDASDVERNRVCRAVLARLDAWVEALLAGDVERLRRAWLERCAILNRRVRVEQGGRRLTGRVLDVSPLEGLVLLTDEGAQVHLPAATSTILD